MLKKSTNISRHALIYVKHWQISNIYSHCFLNFFRRFFAILSCGQFLSLVLCAIGVGSQKLVIVCGVKIPGFLAFCNYMLLSAVFTTKIACKPDKAMRILKGRWWKYVLIAIVDVYGNFLVLTAYSYTSLTSVQVNFVYHLVYTDWVLGGAVFKLSLQFLLCMP